MISEEFTGSLGLVRKSSGISQRHFKVNQDFSGTFKWISGGFLGESWKI